MFTPVPFAITPEAAGYIRCRLSESEPGRMPSLVRAFGYADGLSDAVYYMGEHFQIIYQNEAPKREAQRLDLFGQRVTIERDTLRRLTNRILSLYTIHIELGAKHVLVSP